MAPRPYPLKHRKTVTAQPTQALLGSQAASVCTKLSPICANADWDLLAKAPCCLPAG